MTTIDVIIPSYNQEKYLSDAVESVITQTQRPNKLIIIDDGSTDNSLAIAQKYASEHDWIQVVSQVNKGLSSARNTGIMNSTAEWIQPLDADDILADNALEILSQHISDDVDIIGPSLKTFGTSNETVILGTPTLEDFKTANRIGYFSLYRRSMALAIGGYSARMVEGYEDYHFWINMLSRGARIEVIPDVLVLYRTKEVSMITDAVKHHDKLMSQIHKDFPELYA